MRFAGLSCALTCLAFVPLAVGCAVPEVQFFADDASPDHSAQDGAADAGSDAVSDASGGDATDAPASPGCPSMPPSWGPYCCGAVPCSATSGSQCMTLCAKCNQCFPNPMPGDLCCIKANVVTCWNVDAGPCP